MAKPDLDAMNADELRQIAASLFNVVEAKDTELKHGQSAGQYERGKDF